MRLHFIADKTSRAQECYQQCLDRYPNYPLTADNANARAEAIVVIGGDGFMLLTLHQLQNCGLPFYGLNRGSLGFLMNQWDPAEDLQHKVTAAKHETLYPLALEAIGVDGKKYNNIAINEVSLLRYTAQAAKLRIKVDGIVRLEQLVCDGMLVSTPAGSTAYNLSAYGPIIPIGVDLMVMTPLSAFRPRRWRGALIPSASLIEIEALEYDKRPVNAFADSFEVTTIVSVKIYEQREQPFRVMFDRDQNLAERIIKEQFEC